MDAESGETTRYASSYQAYTNEQYTQILTDAGFSAILFRPGLSEEHEQDGLQVVVAVKPS